MALRYLLFSLLALPFHIIAQEKCACEDDLNFVIDYYERNLPGFGDNVTSENRSTYTTLKETVLREARESENSVSCFKSLTYYVEYFKDNHSKIIMRTNQIDESDETAVKEFKASAPFTSRETYTLHEDDLKQYGLSDIRGIYSTADGTYTVAVVPNPGILRDYIGVITKSTSKLWEPGQVKFEVKQKMDGGFEAFSYQRNHSLLYSPNFYFKNGQLGNSWIKLSRKDKVNHSLNKESGLLFRILSDSIVYLSIPTFSGGFTAAIDSFYKTHHKTIESTPYLIIDVRNNGGGSDGNVSPLLDFIYTKPIQSDKVDLFVTADNIKMWETWTSSAKEDPKNYSRQDVKWYELEVKKMKKAKLGSFIPRSKGKLYKRKVNPKRPKQVAILYNRNCASSCETLLFWGRQSDNSVLVGENSGGYVGYGEVGGVDTPCYNYRLFCTMTRYENQRAFEVVGIPPDVRLSDEEDWIDQTARLLQGN